MHAYKQCHTYKLSNFDTLVSYNSKLVTGSCAIKQFTAVIHSSNLVVTQIPEACTLKPLQAIMNAVS